MVLVRAATKLGAVEQPFLIIPAKELITCTMRHSVATPLTRRASVSKTETADRAGIVLVEQKKEPGIRPGLFPR
jgi:hypothetical protein